MSTAPECLSISQLREWQSSQLQRLLDLNWGPNPFWTRKYAAVGVERAAIHTLEDLQLLPCTTKAELVADQAAASPYGTNLRRPVTDYTRLHQTSGTTGKPLRWLDTAESWDWITHCWSLIYRLIDVRLEDRFCFAFSFGPFLGFWAAFDGAVRTGHLALAAGGLSSLSRLQMIFDQQASIVCCTPTYAARLVTEATEAGFDLARGPVRALIVAGEPGGSLPTLRAQLEAGWGARVFDHWGMTELGPLAVEHQHCPGDLLLLESECIAEILDPVTQQPVEPGTPGELVVTNLGRIDSPLVRYRTGDIVRAATDSRPDLPPWLRLVGGIQGRTDDMLTIRGNNLYPSVLEEWLREIPEIVEFRIELITRRAMQHLRIAVEVTPELSADATENVLQRIRRLFLSRLNFQVEVTPVAAGSLPRPEMKSRRFQKRTEE